MVEPRSNNEVHAPEEIRKTQLAFFHDLPGSLKNPRLRGGRLAYRGDERVRIGRSDLEILRECLRRGLSDDKYHVFVIEPKSSEPEEVEYPSAGRGSPEKAPRAVVH